MHHLGLVHEYGFSNVHNILIYDQKEAFNDNLMALQDNVNETMDKKE